MLYIYYMKKIFISLSLLFVFALYPALSNAQLAVVKIDEKKIYLDTSETDVKIQKGQPFKIILSSEKLTNPKTGKELGNIYQYSPVGKIIEVQPLYAIGELPHTTGISIGQEAVLEEPIAEPAVVSAAAATAESPAAPARPKIIYAPIEQEIISVTEADVSAPGAKNVITLSEDRQVIVWTRGDDNTLKKVLSYKLSDSAQPITISAAPVKEGLAQIFVTVYLPSSKRISTWVLENKNGALEHTDSLPYFVKEQGCGQNKTIWAQAPFVSGKYPGNARQVAEEEGGITVSKKSFPTQRNWLTGVAQYDIEKDGSENLLYTSSNGTLRLILQNGKRVQSKDLFASSPNRVKYKQEILKFYPSVQVFGPHGDATIAAVENDAKLGLLSKTFGQYQSGKIHFLKYENGLLAVQNTTPMDGVVHDTACSDQTILAAEVLPSGNSRIVEILK